MQQDLEQLTQQLLLQQRQVRSLQQRIDALTGSSHPIKQQHLVTPAPEHKSLENFIGLRVIHLIGIIVLVIGLSIGVKYAIDKNLISEGMRISLAYAASAALFLLSVRLKKPYAMFSAILFSGAMASAYFTTYGAFVYYGMISFSLAFVIMVVLTLFTVYQALVYNRQEIALLGLVGAYAIPFLISKNADRADLFFAYISLINGGVVFLSIKKQWATVGRVAQYVTWILFIGWASTRFDTRFQWSAFLYMSFFFLLFLFNAVVGQVLHRQKLGVPHLYQLILNNIALYIAALFVFGNTYEDADLAKITLLMSVIAAVQAFLLHYLWGEEYAKRILGAYAFILLIVFIGFQWSGLTVTLLWLLVAVVVFAFGAIRKWVSFRMASIVLMGATLFKLVVFDSLTFSTIQKVISYLVLGVLLLVISYFYQKYRDQLFH